MSAHVLQDLPLVRLEARHLDAAHRLSVQENWPHRRAEWALLLATGTGFGIVAGYRLVGTAILTPSGTLAATCSMIIVDGSMRGSRLGRRLMEALLAEAGPRACRLTATDSGLPLYEELGFVATGRIRQFQGTVTTPPVSDGVVAASRADLPAIAGLDRSAIGMDRGLLLDRLMTEGTILCLRDAAGLKGYVGCRAFGRGDLMGPLAARDDLTAEGLMRAAIARHAGRFLRVDLTEAGAHHIPLVEAAGLLRGGGGIAMTRPGSGDPCPEPSGADIYALASQALC